VEDIVGMSGNLVPFSPGQAITLLAALTISSSWGGGRELVSKDLERESAALWFFPLSARPIADAGATFDTCCNAAWSVQPAGLRRFEAVRETSCNGASDYIYSGTHTGEYPFYAGVAFDFDLSAVPIGAKIDSVRVVICAAALPAEAKGELKGNISYWDPDRDGMMFFENDEGGLVISVPPAASPSNPFTLQDVATARLPAFPPSTTGKTSTSTMRLYLFGDNVAVSQIYLRVAIV
jgi:hypothetical protein